MLQEMLKHLQKEWDVVSGAPWAFLISSALAFVVSFAANKWRYSGIIDNLKERIETYKERLTAKDAQLDEYRERLHLVPASGSEFSKLTHAELKIKTLEVVSKLRSWLVKYSEEERRILDAQWQAMCRAQDEEEKNRLWHQHTSTSSQISLRRNAEYDSQFKVDTILLRDEILSRLPSESRDERAYHMYEHPTNPIGIGMVADDLERISKKLC